MYVPERFTSPGDAILRRLIDENDFGTLISVADGAPVLTHIPFLREGDRLLAHMAKANAHWKLFAANPRVLVEFVGPHAYISPAWYPPRPDNVPTWNYVAVHVHGGVSILEDDDRKWDVVAKLVDLNEARYGTGWSVDRGAAEKMLPGIVAFEIAIEKLEGNLKLGQHQPPPVRTRVAEELIARDEKVGEWMMRVTKTP